MEALLECVPNVSDGHDAATLDAIATALSGRPGAWLLDRTSDPDHERSVFTVAGQPAAVAAAMRDGVEVTIERIDRRGHHGQHPRIGAVDVIPFIPMGDMSMDRCVDLARTFAADISQRFGLPVFLYGHAAVRDDRSTLASIRRAGFEGLAAAMRASGGAPDLGPAEPHPSAGAVAVGARRFLIAFNMQLTTADVSIARRMATRIRERDGGLPSVQALGLYLGAEGHAQLSTNILDHEVTPLWRVWEEAQRLARAERVELLDSELVGLVPLAALVEVADRVGVATSASLEERLGQAGAWLRIRRFDPAMVLERRLAARRPV
jgi:glutamate formiminotransferase